MKININIREIKPDNPKFWINKWVIIEEFNKFDILGKENFKLNDIFKVHEALISSHSVIGIWLYNGRKEISCYSCRLLTKEELINYGIKDEDRS